MIERLSFNIAVDLTGILGMVFILMSFALNAALKSEKTKRLCGVLVLYVAVMLADIVVCSLNADPAAKNLLYFVLSANLVLQDLMILMFVSYLRMELGIKMGQWRLQGWIIAAVSAVLILFAATNPAHRLLFVVSPVSGAVQRGRGFWLLPGPFCLILSICLHAVLVHREVRWQTRLSLGFYCLLHIAALVAQLHFMGTVLLDLASLLSILVLYSSYYAEQNLKYSQQELELQNARAALVLSQIQPHFLFNSMAAVMDLCDTDPREAKAALQELSDYLHYKISALSRSFLVCFTEDMEFLQNYLKLEKRRFGDRLRVEYDIGVRDFRVPLLTLQPLAENAVRHGISKKPEGGTIRIVTRQVAEYYSILVEDDGVGFNPTVPNEAPGEHVGLSNVRARLATLCSGSLTVRSTPGAGTTVEITIRKEQEEGIHENTGRG